MKNNGLTTPEDRSERLFLILLAYGAAVALLLISFIAG